MIERLLFPASGSCDQKGVKPSFAESRGCAESYNPIRKYFAVASETSMQSAEQTREERHDPKRWLERHGDVLYRYALMHMGNPAAAEDAVQETLIAAWRGHDGFQGTASERSWLFGILRHKINDYFRTESRWALLDEHSEEPDFDAADDIEAELFTPEGRWRIRPGGWGGDPLDHYEQQQFWQVFRDCLAHLPQRLREGFMMREVQEEEVARICTVLTITENHLYVLLHRARLRMRLCLESNWFQGDRNT